MHRIDTSGHVNGRFGPGNPATGQQATLVDEHWLNAIQEEIVSVIAGANITLQKGTNNQLAAAITAIVAGVVGTGSGAVPTTRRVLTGGLATGGGDLVSDRTITVPKATAAEVSAQTDDAKAVTPLGLAGLVGLTTVSGAWIIRVGSVIFQLFSATANANATTVLTLPQAFPTNIRAAFCNGGSVLTNAQDNNPFVTGRGLSSVSVFSARDTATTVDILAIGN